MLQQIYLLRHAHALDDAPTDAQRPLSPKGRRQCRRLAKGFSKNGMLKADTLWHSGLLRALETATDLAESLRLELPLAKKTGLAPYDNPSSIASQLDQLHENCLVVGHEPNLSLLTSLLLCGNPSFQRLTFSKASLLCLSRIKAETQSTPWQIEWHLSHLHFK